MTKIKTSGYHCNFCGIRLTRKDKVVDNKFCLKCTNMKESNMSAIDKINQMKNSIRVVRAVLNASAECTTVPVIKSDLEASSEQLDNVVRILDILKHELEN